MQPLPKIVSARLQSAPRSEHPDADVLTAFAERSLPHSERALVMEHLSRCGGCREVLALALPEMEEAVAPAVVRRPWFNLPSLNMPMPRWGVVAAAFVVAASIGVIRYQRHTPQTTIVLLKPDTEVRPRIASDSAILPSEAPTKGALAVPGAGKPSPTVAPPARGDSIAHAAISGRNQTSLHALDSPLMAQGQPVLATPSTMSSGNALKSPPAYPASPVPAQTETVEVATAAPMQAEPSPVESQKSQLSQQSVSQTDQLSADQSLSGQSSSGQSSSSQSEGRAIIGKAKAAVTAQTGAALAGSSSETAQVFSVPRWTITSTGGLQRSYDQGKTWQGVSVAAVSQPAASALQMAAAASSRQNQDQKVPRSKKQKDSIVSPVFRAISASGSEIWAGAAGGVLYHSVDSGDHWLSAIPSYNGIFLTGDIVSVQFADSLHGRLATSTSETWATGDGGQHWSKQ